MYIHTLPWHTKAVMYIVFNILCICGHRICVCACNCYYVCMKNMTIIHWDCLPNESFIMTYSIQRFLRWSGLLIKLTESTSGHAWYLVQKCAALVTARCWFRVFRVTRKELGVAHENTAALDEGKGKCEASIFTRTFCCARIGLARSRDDPGDFRFSMGICQHAVLTHKSIILRSLKLRVGGCFTWDSRTLETVTAVVCTAPCDRSYHTSCENHANSMHFGFSCWLFFLIWECLLKG